MESVKIGDIIYARDEDGKHIPLEVITIYQDGSCDACEVSEAEA